MRYTLSGEWSKIYSLNRMLSQRFVASLVCRSNGLGVGEGVGKSVHRQFDQEGNQ